MSGSTGPPAQDMSQEKLNGIVIEYLTKKGYTRTRDELLHEATQSTETSVEPLLVISSTISQDGTKGIRIEQDGNLVAVFRKDISFGLQSDQELDAHAKPSHAFAIASPRPEAISQSIQPLPAAQPVTIPSVIANTNNVTSTQPTTPNVKKTKVGGWRAQGQKGHTEEESSADITSSLDGESDTDTDAPEGTMIKGTDTTGVITKDELRADRPSLGALDDDRAAKLAEKKGLDGNQSLASAMARAGSTRLGIDLYGDSATAQFCGKLLDTIQRLEAESKHFKRLWQEEINGFDEDESSISDVVEESEQEEPAAPPARIPILHWVQCDNSCPHTYNNRLTADKPQLQTDDKDWHAFGHIYGIQPISSLGRYLEIHKHVDAAVIYVYYCPKVPRQTFLGQKSASSRDNQFSSQDANVVASQAYICVSSKELELALTRDATYQIPRVMEDPWPLMLGLQKTTPWFRTPFPFIFHHLETLQSAIRDGRDTGGNIEAFLECVNVQFGAMFTSVKALFSNGIVTPKHAELLFRINGGIITEKNKETVACVIKDPPVVRQHSVSLSCWMWKFDGTVFKREHTLINCSIPDENENLIKTLNAYPVEYADKSLVTTLVDARFMIDWATYRRVHPESFKHQLEYQRNTHEILDRLPASMTCDDEPMSLRVEGIENVVWNKKAFEHLMLPKPTKTLVRALVETHEGSGVQEDIIAGKGNGVILLLHGGPGTGKTLTAEKYLTTVLYLGRIWNCVLLFDEADVFLEERTLFDLPRNSLVSVFLRILEYYEGILILTSNRVGTFDEAFKSRIQVAIHYKDLTRISRKKIWQNFTEMMEESDYNANISELYEKIDELSEKNMNGRQIRNAITTARRLALFEKEPLSWKHLDQVIKISGDFDQYLESVHGHSDADRARDEKIR
ncbi:hypothetical protein VF21_00987 [Pseudogymnoascus sp. 05NY08]|nr:hypothetical protein VF21_00987 [Pseudogymnoascus sp. 05NY08]